MCDTCTSPNYAPKLRNVVEMSFNIHWSLAQTFVVTLFQSDARSTFCRKNTQQLYRARGGTSRQPKPLLYWCASHPPPPPLFCIYVFVRNSVKQTCYSPRQQSWPFIRASPFKSRRQSWTRGEAKIVAYHTNGGYGMHLRKAE